MTPEQQRIAIAEACGWKKIHEVISADNEDCSATVNKLVPYNHVLKKNEYAGWVDLLNMEDYLTDYGFSPNYLNDLNAMHEAEQVLTHHSLITYGEELCGVCAADQHDRVYLVPEVFRATAAQRAEAFLRTLNLWKD